MKIAVDKPLIERTILKTVTELHEMGYKRDTPIIRTQPVNRETEITVRTGNEQTNEELCFDLTGLTPSAYQSLYNRAWNE